MEICNGTISFISEHNEALKVHCEMAYMGHERSEKRTTRLKIALWGGGGDRLTYDLEGAKEIVRLAQQAIAKAEEFLDKYPMKEE